METGPKRDMVRGSKRRRQASERDYEAEGERGTTGDTMALR